MSKRELISLFELLRKKNIASPLNYYSIDIILYRYLKLPLLFLFDIRFNVYSGFDLDSISFYSPPFFSHFMMIIEKQINIILMKISDNKCFYYA